MKKILMVMALAASVVALDANAQVKPAAAKAAVEKAAATTENPKQNTKTATWLKYGKALLDAYNAPSGNIWIGMNRSEYQMIAGGEQPTSETTVEVGGRAMTKLSFADKNIYFNDQNTLEIIEVVNPVVDNALDKALGAYAKAYELDAKGQKTKDITEGINTVATKYSEEAYTSYSLGNVAEASNLFEKAANAAATAPLSQVDTNSIYNAAFTAWANGDNERAKTFFQKSLDYGYAGTDGETYAKLADICTKTGDAAAGKQYLEEGFSKYPQSQSILVGLINYYLTSGEDTNRLFELLGEAKKNEPTNASLYYVEGNINEQLGNGDAAVAAYRECAEIDPNYYYGYIGEGIHFYNLAVDIQEKASTEMNDAKYTALMGEFETSLKSCIAPFETAYEKCNDADIKSSVAEYLKNACFRFRSEDPSYQEKYDKYAAAAAGTTK